MSRTLSTAALSAILAAETSQVFVTLADIAGSGIDTLRIANNTQDVTSGGNVYAAFPFTFTLPADDPDQSLRASLEVCNVDRQVVAALRQLSAAPTVTINVVLAASPSTVELGPLEFKAVEVSYDVLSVRLSLEYEDVLNERIPGDVFTPGKFPGVFKS